MESEYEELVPAFEKTVLESSIDIVQDYAEIAIDAFINDGIFKDFPIVSTLAGVGKTIAAIRDRYFMKKTLIFTQKLHDGTIPQEKINVHKEKLEKNPKKLYKEMEYIIILIDRHISYVKNKILANFYSAYIGQSIEWDDFEVLAEALDQIAVSDLASLKDICGKGKYGVEDSFNELAMARLGSLFLVRYFNGGLVRAEGSDEYVVAASTGLGEIFCELGFKGIDFDER